MNADELLENLGFLKVSETAKYIRYEYHPIPSIRTMCDKIDFDLGTKRVRFSNVTGSGNSSMRYASIEELKAVMKKSEELGW